MTTSLAALPHKKSVFGLIAAIWAVFVIIELTPAGQWIFETGTIHLFAITYAVLAFALWMSPRLATGHDFRSFARLAAMAMLALGTAHVVEYFGDTRGFFSEETVAVVVSGAYLIAFLLVIYGAGGLMRMAGMRTRWVNSAIAALAAAHVLASTAFYVKGFLSEDTIGKFLGVILLVGAIVAIVLLEKLGRKMAVLRRFTRYLQIAVALVLCSYSFEVFFDEFQKLGLREQQVENYAHYLFYTGLTVFALSFDSLRHLGGIFADLQKEIEEITR